MKKSNAFNRFVLCTSGILLALLLVSSSVKAQCPTDIAPTGVSWTGPNTVTITIPGTTCHVYVTYCWRVVSGVEQRYIAELKPLTSGYDGLTWVDIMNAAREDQFQSIQTDTCWGGHVSTVATVFTASCSEMTHINGYVVAKYCAGAYCAKTCHLCADWRTFKNLESDCTFTQLGTANCSTAPDGWPNLSVSVRVYGLQGIGTCVIWARVVVSK